ncbi:alanine racemase [bacterium]|nr:alanine racemase [bacterium]
MVRHSSRIELSQSAMRHNINFLRSILGPHTDIALVVKANAYGHGIAPILKMGEKSGIGRFAVASSHEAAEVLENASERTRVLIMGILYDEDLTWAVESELEFYVFDLQRLEKAVTVAQKIGKPARIHLEIETGGNRTGLAFEDLDRAVKLIKAGKKHLHLVGVCSHLAGAETFAAHFRIARQVEAFNRLKKRFDQRKLAPEMYHLASSAASIAMPEVAFDMVRIGTAAYGIWPSPDVYNQYLLRSGQRELSHTLTRVMSWKTDVMHVKTVKKDEFIGYGTSFQAYRDMRIAVMPLGYANGYPREMSNRGHVLIHGRKAPVVGSVNMNMFMADISSIPDVQIGDEVVLIGRQKRNSISLRSFSEFSSALNNEFVSRLPAAIPRTIVR